MNQPGDNMADFAVLFKARIKNTAISNKELADKIGVHPITISRWKKGAIINGKLQVPSQREYLLASIEPLGFAREGEKALEECNQLFQAAGHAVLDLDEQKKYFPPLKAEPPPSPQLATPKEGDAQQSIAPKPLGT
jgi:hypothetical protein